MLTVKNKEGDQPLEKRHTDWEKEKRRFVLFIYACMTNVIGGVLSLDSSSFI